jgi:hypothetical protein
MKRGGSALEDGSLGGGNMVGVVHRRTGIGPGMPLRYADQTAAWQASGHFASKSALGAHVTRSLARGELESVLGYLAYGYPRQCARPPLLVTPRGGARGRTAAAAGVAD